MRKLLLVIGFLLLANNSWAANLFAKTTGGNWSAASTWSNVSSAGVDNSGPPTSATDVIFDAASATLGAVVVDSSAAVAKTLTVQATCTGTLTHSSSFVLTVSGSITFVSTMNYNATAQSTPNSSSPLVMNASGTLTTGGELIAGYKISSGTCTLGDDLNFLASKMCSINISGTAINLNGFNILGNSAVNRVLIYANALGTPKQLTVTADTQFAYADFRDITFSSAANRDFSGITGNSGDCGGNSITGGGTVLTFTNAATQTWTGGANENWSTATWTSRVPLPQDNVILSGTHATNHVLTADMPRLGKDISFGTASHLTLGNAVTSYGSLDLTGMGTFGGIYTWIFDSGVRSGTNTLTSAGKNFPSGVTINTVGTTFSLADALSLTGSVFTFNGGTLLDNGNSITAYSVASTGTITRTITKTGDWILQSSASFGLEFTSGATLTFSDAGTITFTNTGSSNKTFAGGGKTFNNFTITGGGTGAVIITGSNTFTNITVNAPKTLTLTGSTTQQVGQFVALGSAGNMITLNSPTLTTTPPVLNKTGGGTVQCNYLNIQGVNVTPANTWYYGNNSVDGLGLNFGGQATSGDYVSAANSATANQFYGSTAYSIEAWVIARSLGGNSLGRILNKSSSTSVDGYGFWVVSSNYLTFSGFDTAQRSTITNTRPLTFNQLAHVVLSWTDGAAPDIYVDGTECGYSTNATITTPNDESIQSLLIGNIVAITRTWDGTIYAVRIYRNVALSAANVTTLYNAGVKAVNPLGNATSEYMFNDGSGTNLDDDVGGVDGTITGADWANTGWNIGYAYNAFDLAGN